MYCPDCGKCIDNLEKKCREEFYTLNGGRFDNVEKTRRKKGFCVGLMAGIIFNVLLCGILLWANGWLWNGFLQSLYHMYDRSIIFVLGLLLIPLIFGMGFSVSYGVDADLKKE
jgi:hypothetical protein